MSPTAAPCWEFGRGLGRVEFEGFQRNMNESRERFVEYGEALLNALESGYIGVRRPALHATANHRSARLRFGVSRAGSMPPPCLRNRLAS